MKSVRQREDSIWLWDSKNKGRAEKCLGADAKGQGRSCDCVPGLLRLRCGILQFDVFE